MTACQPISIVPSRERHAALRLNERYGLAFTLDLKVELFRQIEAARVNDNRAPMACRINAYGDRERWLVSIDHRIVHVVINPAATVVVTFLPLHGPTAGHP